MPAEPTVRDSRPGDVPALCEIYAAEVLQGTASFELTPPDLAEMAARRQAIVAAGLPYLVAELDGKIAGYAYAGPYRPRPAYLHTVENSVYTARWARRQGVGHALLGRLIPACEAIGKRQMVAVIGDTDNVGSIALHAAFGFTHVGTLRKVGFKHGRWLDVVLMQRPLGDGGDSLPGE